MAVETNYFPLYEVIEGKTKINYYPKSRVEIIEFFKLMGRTSHLQKPEYAEILAEVQAEVDRRFRILQAKNDSELL